MDDTWPDPVGGLAGHGGEIPSPSYEIPQNLKHWCGVPDQFETGDEAVGMGLSELLSEDPDDRRSVDEVIHDVRVALGEADEEEIDHTLCREDGEAMCGRCWRSHLLDVIKSTPETMAIIDERARKVSPQWRWRVRLRFFEAIVALQTTYVQGHIPDDDWERFLIHEGLEPEDARRILPTLCYP